MTTSNELLPCPFCGHDEPTHDEGDESAWVQCTNAECGMCGPIASGPALAAAAWNRRATQPAAGTTSDQYRAELYDEVWQKARDMGYGNVTDALVELERFKWAKAVAGKPAAVVEQTDYPYPVSSQIDVPLPVGTQLYTVSPAAAHGDEAVPWVECGERLPESGRPVLAFYTNRAGKGRRIRANYVAPKTHEVDFADPDTQCVEYDEEADCFYLQAGWYELIDNWEEYSSIAVIEGDVSHWMPLPAQPAMRAQAGEGGEV